MITRRTFVKTTAACLAANTLPLYALAPLTIGIGTFSYHALSFDDMMAQLEILLPTNGLHNQQIEMSRGEFMVMSHPSDELVRTSREKLDKAGIRCVSYYAATLKNEQDVASAVRYAQLLGAHNITGDATGADLLKHIDRTVTGAGLTFSIHNHFFPGVKFPYESPEDVLNALAPLSANCGATADTGHFAACGYDPVDAVRSGENVLLGSGIAKIPEVEVELHRQNFRRLVAIEYEKEGDDDVRDDMRTNVAFAWQYGFSGA
jgi:sugar phosphate isomerase/epimerase